MGRIIGILISSIIFYIIFKFLGLVPVHGTHVFGFLYGIAHGYILIPSFVVNLFTHHQPLYATPNTGNTYWLGFLIGFLVLGGLGFVGRR